MKIFDITQHKKGIPVKSIHTEIAKNSGKIVIDYPMSYINFSQSHLDVIHNYLEASYISEELGKYAVSIEAQLISQNPYPPICRYQIVVKEVQSFIEVLTELSIALYDDQNDDNIIIDHMGNLEMYAETLDYKTFLCPNLIDGYYANLINGAYFELEAEYEEDSEDDDGFLATEYKKYPEREFGFWKSAYSKNIGNDFYVSDECWVVPSKIDIQSLILKYSGLYENEIYGDAILFSLDNISYLANQHGIVYFPFSSLLQAKKFVSAVLIEDNMNLRFSENILTFSSEIDDFEEYVSNSSDIETEQVKYLLSRTSQSIIVEEKGFRYVFFPDQIRSDKLVSLYNQTSKIFGFVGEFIGIGKNINLAWENFDDEKFETLCYEIIYYHPKFDNTTIRKMGKSRSRDGGRDIVVQTKERLGSPKKMYIFQCKLTKSSSLGAQKVENISDTIAQYQAQGYGVMTSAIIDATLYDKIDAVCADRKIESENFSILEIERFIARNPKLKKKYFK